MSTRPLVLAMTGASGAIYAVRLLQLLMDAGRQVHLCISPAGRAVIQQELNVVLPQLPSLEDIAQLLAAVERFGASKDTSVSSMLSQTDQFEAKRVLANALEHLHSGCLQIHGYEDYFTPIASGSHLTEGMVICPCSGSTLSGIVRSASSNLIERAAEVHLKERRKLIVVPRETPLSTFQIENMLRASQAGIVVLPAAPGWYHGINGLQDLVDFVVARILDQLNISHQLMHRWAE